MRRTGIEVIGSVPWGTHFCQFYETARDLVETLVPYFRQGLEQNEFCMWVTAAPLQVRQAKAALRAAVPDLDRYIKKGQLEILDYKEWYLTSGKFKSDEVLQGWVDKLNSALERGFEGLRLTGNTFWLEKAGWKDFTEYEAAVNSVIGRYRMLAMCTYSLRKCGATEIMDVIVNHQFALIKRRGQWEIIESPEHKKTQQALRESEEQYCSLFNNMTEGFALHEIITDERGRPSDYRFLDVNPAFETLTGLKRTDILGRRVREILPAIESFWIETYGKVALSGEPTHVENYAEPLDRWYEVFAYRPAPRRFAAIFTDITARKEAAERAAYLATFPENNPNPVLEVGMDGQLLYSNPAARRLFPDLAERRLEHPWLADWPSIAGPFCEGRTEAVVRSVTLGGRCYQQTVFCGPEGRFIRIYAQDITDRMKAEEELRESEKRLSRTQEIAHLGSWELDLVNNRLSWSDETYRIFGLGPREFEATYEGFLEAVHPDDRAAVDAAYSGSVREGRDSYEIEHRVVRKSDGDVRWVHEKCEHLRDSAGRIVRSVGMVLDITESRRAEQALRLLAEEERLRLAAAVEQASESIIMAGLDGTIQYVNAAFEGINRRSEGEVLGKSYFGFLAGEPQEKEIREAFGQGGQWTGRLARKAGEGDTRELDVAISPVRDPNGRILSFLVVERDITREAKLQQHMRQTQKAEALGTLAGGIAHDFNNVLSTIAVNSELALLELEEKARARSPLPLVLQAVLRGKELVKQIITFSRQREQERRPMKISPVLKETLKFLRSSLPQSIEIQEDIIADTDTVLADPSQIHQILINLCSNAAYAMREEGGRLGVHLAAKRVDAAMAALHPDLKPGPYLRLTVSDTGHGMSPEVMDRIFDPFFTTKAPGEGSGLGLSVVQGIVKSYGGAITVYSKVGHGSTFNVFLPRMEEELEAKKVQPEAIEGGTERILLVEDEEAQLESFRNALQKLGYRVTARISSAAALADFRRDPDAFDLVITDQAMPQMTGAKLVEEMLKVRPGLAIILCTGFSEVVNGEEARLLGVREFVMKPFSIAEIARAVRRALGKEKS
jgi:PAS domain S-box-containing protein